jgi:ABC-type branched-subunit amino acid transport system ATPase component
LATSPALRVNDLRAAYAHESDVLKGVSLEAYDGEICAIIGPNGAGKSTFLKSLYGELTWITGRAQFNTTDLLHSSPSALTRAGVAYVPQERNVFAGLSIVENIELACATTGKAARNKVRAALDRYPVLREKSKLHAGSLSGGQRQLLALAMALMNDPKLLLLDEPTAGLSPVARSSVFREIRALAKDQRCIVLVEQNAIEALSIADRGYVFVDGRNALSGPANEMLKDPAVRRSFLGNVD